MVLAQSKISARGRTSVPAKVQEKLGIGPGSVLEWEQKGDAVIVRRASRYTSEDIHGAIFQRGMPPFKKSEDFDHGVRRYMKKKRVRR